MAGLFLSPDQIAHYRALIMACDDAGRLHVEFGLSGAPQIAIKILRKPSGNTMRVLPGVTGRVVGWGNAEQPSVVMVGAGKLKGVLMALLEKNDKS